MRIATKKSWLLIAGLTLSLLQLSFVLVTTPVGAQENHLLQSQEGFQNNEIQSAFTNEEPEDIRVTVVRIINIVLSVVGVVFLILIVLAGFKYMTAAGNEDQVSTAVKQITQAVIGFVIIASAWGVSYFILLRISAAASGATNYLYF